MEFHRCAGQSPDRDVGAETLKTDDRAVNLLWTGGWDSTFRLLQLVLSEGKTVKPFYLISVDRRSTGKELQTIRDIKRRLLELYPDTRKLLLPTHFTEITDVPPDPDITQAYESLVKERHLGNQYDYLARFCKHYGISDMELGVHRDDKAHAVLEALVEESPEMPCRTCRVSERHAARKEYVLFRYFHFPIFAYDKKQMAAIAADKGWSELMNMTWFCHNPRLGKYPCGTCNPCAYTIEEGFGQRVPLLGRLLHRLAKMKRRRVHGRHRQRPCA